MATSSLFRSGQPLRLAWYWYLVTGIAWIIIGWIVLRFDYVSVAAVAALAGIVVLLAALAEILYAMTRASWRWLHIALAVIFAIAGIVILARPGQSFVWIAAFLGWYFLFKGFFDIVVSIATRVDNEAWWLLLIVGVVELLLGFWAAGRYVRSAALLIIWVAALAIARGIGDIVLAFGARRLAHEAESRPRIVPAAEPGREPTPGREPGSGREPGPDETTQAQPTTPMRGTGAPYGT
ncbi:MAG TPA: DUF308 domain-containing protein [Micromonosporaceae bacterium]